MDKYKKIYYEISIAILALLAAAIVIIQSTLDISMSISNKLHILEKIIWIVFVLDYVIRLIISKRKIEFIKNNKIDLISILPFNAMLKSLRILNIFKIVKAGKLTRLLSFTTFVYKFKERIVMFTRLNNFVYISILTLVTILIGAGAISIIEKKPFVDSLWFSIVTATSVGYGEIIPETYSGKIIACMLMLVGIGFVGVLTGTIAVYFMNKNNKYKTYKEEIIEEIQVKLRDFQALSKEDIDDICNVLMSLKSKDENNK